MALTKAKILVWLLQTETGDRDELNIPEGGKLLWNRICSDAYSRAVCKVIGLVVVLSASEE